MGLTTIGGLEIRGGFGNLGVGHAVLPIREGTLGVAVTVVIASGVSLPASESVGTIL